MPMRLHAQAREPSRAERTVPGALASAWERRVCEDVAVRPHGAAEVFREVQKDARGDRLARLRTLQRQAGWVPAGREGGCGVRRGL